MITSANYLIIPTWVLALRNIFFSSHRLNMRKNPSDNLAISIRNMFYCNLALVSFHIYLFFSLRQQRIQDTIKFFFSNTVKKCDSNILFMMIFEIPSENCIFLKSLYSLNFNNPHIKGSYHCFLISI